MLCIGIDYRKKYSFTTKMNEKGDVLSQEKISNDPLTLTRYLSELPKEIAGSGMNK